jgi:hypothetical protein
MERLTREQVDAARNASTDAKIELDALRERQIVHASLRFVDGEASEHNVTIWEILLAEQKHSRLQKAAEALVVQWIDQELRFSP